MVRREGVEDLGFGTFYRHLPTLEELLEGRLRIGFDNVTFMAEKLEASDLPDLAPVVWLGR